MSWLNSAVIISGPTVGSDRTIATIDPPETSRGNSPPIVEMNGFNAIRTGYLNNSFTGRTPLAIAVMT